MGVTGGLQRQLSTEELMLSISGAKEDSLVSLGQQRRSNQSILKEINSEYSLGRLMLRLKLKYFGRMIQRVNLLEKTLMQGMIEGKRRRGKQDEMVGCHG